MMGMSVSNTGTGVISLRMIADRATLNAGSKVFTVWEREMATAAKDTLAAMWPNACMLAGPTMDLSSDPVIGCIGGKVAVARAF